MVLALVGSLAFLHHDKRAAPLWHLFFLRWHRLSCGPYFARQFWPTKPMRSLTKARCPNTPRAKSLSARSGWQAHCPYAFPGMSWVHNLRNFLLFVPTQASTATTQSCLYPCDASTLGVVHIILHRRTLRPLSPHSGLFGACQGRLKPMGGRGLLNRGFLPGPAIGLTLSTFALRSCFENW